MTAERGDSQIAEEALRTGLGASQETSVASADLAASNDPAPAEEAMELDPVELSPVAKLLGLRPRAPGHSPAAPSGQRPKP